jgi:hypothetical protein
MYQLACKIAQYFDNFTQSTQYSSFVESMRPPLEERPFDLGEVKAICVEMVMLVNKQLPTKRIQEWDEKDIEINISNLLLYLVSFASNCGITHLQKCKTHQSLLFEIFTTLLSGLSGLELDNDQRKSLESDGLSKNEFELMAQRWGIVIIDPKIFLRVAQAVSETPEDKRAYFLKLLAFLIGRDDEKSNLNRIELLIQKARLDQLQ